MVERPTGEQYQGLPRHDVVAGVRFTPFAEARRFNNDAQNDNPYYAEEKYDHTLYLRRPISLRGISGCIDAITEDPTAIFEKMVANGSGYRTFSDHPYGYFTPQVKLEGGKFVPIDVRTTLRFSFHITNPRDYANLLNTYGIVDIADSRYFLCFNLNPKGIKKAFRFLEDGGNGIVIEKNLINFKELEKMAEEDMQGEHSTTGTAIRIKEPETDEEPPRRIGFVDLPDELNKLQPIGVIFGNYFQRDESEYPPRPTLPNLQPISSLV